VFGDLARIALRINFVYMSLVFVRCVYLMESLRIMSRVFYAFMKEMYDQCTSFSLFRFIYFLWLVEART